MRFSTLTLGVFTAATLLFTSCKKEETTPPETPSTPASGITALISNKSWASDSVNVLIDDSGMVNIIGLYDDIQKLTIKVSGYVVNKEYKINQFTPTKVLYYDSSETKAQNYDSKVEEINTGKVVITKYDQAKKLISGTFAFTLRNSKDTRLLTVEDGVFTDLPYINLKDPDPVADPDTLECAFQPYDIASKLGFTIDGLPYTDSITVSETEGDRQIYRGEGGTTKFSCYDGYTWFYQDRATSFGGSSPVFMKIAKQKMVKGVQWTQEFNNTNDSLRFTYYMEGIESHSVGDKAYENAYRIKVTVSGKADGHSYTTETFRLWVVKSVGIVESEHYKFKLTSQKFF